MKRYKQKELKEFIRMGIAEDITKLSNESIKEIKDNEKGLENIGLSIGTYGMNGGLFKGYESGKLYVITSRNSNLFYLA